MAVGRAGILSATRRTRRGERCALILLWSAPVANFVQLRINTDGHGCSSGWRQRSYVIFSVGRPPQEFDDPTNAALKARLSYDSWGVAPDSVEMAPLALDIQALPLSFGPAPETAAPYSRLAISRFVINSSFDIRISSFDSSISFQEQIHAIEIDYGMTEVQRVHSENATDSRAALPQGETR
jgi:hypothetical protein